MNRRYLLSSALLSLLLVVCACAEDSTVVSPGSDGNYVLRPGQHAVLNGGELTVRFAGVAADSRCPVDVQCVWAGDGEVALALTLSGQPAVDEKLHTNGGGGASSITFGDWRIELLELHPAPLAGRTIPQAEYRITLRIDPL